MASTRKSNARTTTRTKATSRASSKSLHRNGQSRTIESKPTPVGTVITQEAIAQAAYFLWLDRGGDDVSNWLEAEATLGAKSR